MCIRDSPYAVQKFFPAHLEAVIVELPGSAVPNNMSTIYERVLKFVKSAREVYYSGSWTRSTAAEQCASGANFWIEEFQEKPSSLRHYFAGSVSGGLNFPCDFFECCKKRYLIRGPLGSGAVVMNDILVEALSRRYTVEAYHSIIEPSDLVVLFILEIQVAVINGTCCYNELSLLSGDTVWDLGKGVVVPTLSLIHISPYDENKRIHIRPAGFCTAYFAGFFGLWDYWRTAGQFINDHFRCNHQWIGHCLAMGDCPAVNAVQP